MFVVAKGLKTDDGYSTHILSQSFIKSHCQKKYEKKDQELEEFKAQMMRTGEIMRVIGRLRSNGEVWSLTEIKNKSSPKIEAAMKVATQYVRDPVWVERKRSAARLQHVI